MIAKGGAGGTACTILPQAKFFVDFAAWWARRRGESGSPWRLARYASWSTAHSDGCKVRFLNWRPSGYEAMDDPNRLLGHGWKVCAHIS